MSVPRQRGEVPHLTEQHPVYPSWSSQAHGPVLNYTYIHTYIHTTPATTVILTWPCVFPTISVFAVDNGDCGLDGLLDPCLSSDPTTNSGSVSSLPSVLRLFFCEFLGSNRPSRPLTFLVNLADLRVVVVVVVVVVVAVDVAVGVVGAACCSSGCDLRRPFKRDFHVRRFGLSSLGCCVCASSSVAVATDLDDGATIVLLSLLPCVTCSARCCVYMYGCGDVCLCLDGPGRGASLL